MAKMKSAQLVTKAIDIAKNYKTLYVMGCFGAPMTDANKDRYCKNNSYNKQANRTAMIKAASSDTFGFDCVCLIKGILWGWNGDKSKTYGGASYASNGVPDIGADDMIKKCSGVSTDFSNITPGEMLWKEGHAGIYIGDGLGVECTPIWENDVQITAVGNIGGKSGYQTRTWTKHGKLPYVDYTSQQEAPSSPSTPQQDDIDQKIESKFKDYEAKLKIENEELLANVCKELSLQFGKSLEAALVDISGKADKAVEKRLGIQIDHVQDIPWESVRDEMRTMLDLEVIDGGTDYIDDPDDIGLPLAIVRALVVSKRYTEMLVSKLKEELSLLTSPE